ncbi:MAG: NAD-glutamate dehydrogenase [Endozoicomonas sp. (ex Botrylloides leachii)]|nr:NAD-glutamate dehydrogenase [Endozoicomonas sp. (ex Botrylloides leachii)]
MNTFKDVRKLTIEQAQVWMTEHMPEQESKQAGLLADYYFRQTQIKDLLTISADDCYGSLLCLWQFIQHKVPGAFKFRAYNPEPEEHFWHSTHSIIEILGDDMPFLVASVMMELDRQEVAVHNLTHPVIRSIRDKKGQLITLQPADADQNGGHPETLMRIEIDRQDNAKELSRIIEGIQEVISDVEQIVRDRSAMEAQLNKAIHWCKTQPQQVTEEEQAEVIDYLQWLKKDNFLFIGYRYYELDQTSKGTCQRIKQGSALGTFREDTPKTSTETYLSPYLASKLQEPELLIITKSSSRSTVQRHSHMDYLGIKQFNEKGIVIGKWCFFGLFSSQAYSAPIEYIPLLRKKVATLLDMSETPENSHRGKALRHIISNFPRDEILQATQEQLFNTIMGILDCNERRQLRVFLRPDCYDRFVTAMIYVPRDRFNTEMRQRFQTILMDELGGNSVDFNVYLSENPLVQLQFVVHCHNSNERSFEENTLERILTEATLDWKDHLQQAILDKHGEAAGGFLYRTYANAFPAAYREDVHPRQSVADIERLSALKDKAELSTSLYHPVNDFSHCHFRVLGKGEQLALSEVLPILEHMGVRIFSARPYTVHPKDNENSWVHDFSIEPNPNLNLDDSSLREQFQDVFTRTWKGQLENDGFNALVVNAGLNWKQITLIRALAKYLIQLQVSFSQYYMERVLNNNAEITRQLVKLFDVRFSPRRTGNRKKTADSVIAKIKKLLDDVANLDEDRILRHFLSVIQAMLRTSAYQINEEGQPKDYLSFKLKPAAIPAAPQPRPLFEIFVYSPSVEGVHMRGGKIARGGLRWSDRREDFRTEILGLVKAQMVKNAIIVPHGAKGGFIPKQLPVNGSRDEIMAEGVKSYKIFISGLLDITDNMRQGNIIPPDKVVRYDEDDPYLVVAADKGTATFSDIANSMSEKYNFWLGDAFASGGSQGYDHKGMGITARGAWESVKRLFKERSIDSQTTGFTAIGIGDMAGDVFGNGMLLSKHIRLIAAFNHMHIFIDPDPEAETSYIERQKLFKMPRSSWDDYDRSLLSKGGGIYSRQAKKIKLSPEARQALNIRKSTLTPADLIKNILKAPVDLLWNGGIGTYVKASTETHSDVGDRANDNLRINGDELKAKVVGEGGNLGLTQKARIEFARNGGLINTDAVDNSGGVDTSDHEVNIKILLDQIVAAGDMTQKQRNQLLAKMTDEIAWLILRHNFLQSQRLSLSNHQSTALFNDHRYLIRKYEDEERLNRQLECLPTDSEMKARALREEGLCRPEIAVLLSHAKLKLFEDLVEARVDEDDYLSKALYQYFPSQLQESFSEQINQHPLKTEILATHLANNVGNRMGAIFIEYIQQETRCSVIDALRAFIAVVEIQSIPLIWNEFETLGLSVKDEIQRSEQVRIQRLIEQSCIWLIKTHGNNLNIQQLIDTYKTGTDTVASQLDQLVSDKSREWLQKTTGQLMVEKFDSELAYKCAALRYHYYALSIVFIANRNNQPVETAAKVYFSMEDHLSLYWLRGQVKELPVGDLWQRKAQSSIRDQVDRCLGENCSRALSASGVNADEAMADWLKANQSQLKRWQSTISTIQAAPKQSLAMLSVAVQELSLMATS